MTGLLAKQIITQAAADHGFTLDEMLSKKRAPSLVVARVDAMTRLRAQRWQDGRVRYSLPTIGRIMGGMHHTTVLYSLRRHDKNWVEPA